MSNAVHSPSHYTQASVTIEPIDVLRYAPFDLGNAMKYFIRAGHKDDKKQDLEKAKKYIDWASEGCDCNHKPYEEYINKYILFIEKFKVFQGLMHYYSARYFIAELSNKIEAELRKCE